MPSMRTYNRSFAGDCLTACVASLLECEIADLPDFSAMDREWLKGTREWLEANGYACIWIAKESLSSHLISHFHDINREISPEMFGRIDDAKFQSGAATLRNFISTPTGAAENRAGFAFVKATKNNGKARLIPFTFSLNQTMVIELGDRYARFHTQGATLQYNPATLHAWIPSSPDLGYTYTAPAVITWTAHGLTTGDPIRFYQSGSSGSLPGGLQLSYTYTVQVIDANTFNILDASGNAVTFTGGGGGGSVTNYPGSGTASASVNLSPNQTGNVTSAAIGGLANVPIAGGVATLNAAIVASIYRFQSSGTALAQYSNDGGATWNTFFGAGSSTSTNVSTSIALTNLNLLKLRVNVSGQAGPSGSISIDLSINSWSVDVPTSGGGGGGATLRAYRYYTAGDAVSYGGSSYVSLMTDSGGTTQPGTNAAIWALLPADGNLRDPDAVRGGRSFRDPLRAVGRCADAGAYELSAGGAEAAGRNQLEPDDD
jgi:hypothetical protein